MWQSWRGKIYSMESIGKLLISGRRRLAGVVRLLDENSRFTCDGETYEMKRF